MTCGRELSGDVLKGVSRSVVYKKHLQSSENRRRSSSETAVLIVSSKTLCKTGYVSVGAKKKVDELRFIVFLFSCLDFFFFFREQSHHLLRSHGPSLIQSERSYALLQHVLNPLRHTAKHDDCASVFGIVSDCIFFFIFVPLLAICLGM